MTHSETTTRCGSWRQRLADLVVDHLDVSGRMLRHIEKCPRCRRRAMRYARLGLALRLLKTQRQSMGMLLECNRRAIGMLNRNVRELPQALKLRTVFPAPAWRVRLSGYAQGALSAAACLVVLFAARAGVLSSLEGVHDEGTQAMEHYCSILDRTGESGDTAART